MAEIERQNQADEMMQIIEKGFSGEAYDSKEFADAAMSLFREFRDTYYGEWARMDNCDRLYLSDTWPLIEATEEVNGTAEDDCGTDSKMPKPSIPIIHSTIESIESDLDPDVPECYVKPQDGLTEVQARLINFALKRQFEDCGFADQYYNSTHELLTYGWDVFEIGYTPDDFASVDKGKDSGSLYVRHVPSRTILLDPKTSSIQDGRAIFKFDRHPRHWFRVRFPDKYKDMQCDMDEQNDHDIQGDAPQSNVNEAPDSMLLVEMWYRTFDAKANVYRVHMAQFAGGVEVANSAKVRKEGMYEHGQYPFRNEVLFKRPGTPFGYGIADIFAGLQMYSDKLNQIILLNTFRASRSRLVIDATNEDAYDDISDFSKEVIQVPNMAGINWFQDKPLPQYTIAYAQYLQNSIKEESGSNDQSRGVAGGGVTAASAIRQLQEMATKRSTKISARRHELFRNIGAMCIDTLADCGLEPLRTVLTINGQPTEFVITSELFENLRKGKPMLSNRVYIRTTRQDNYSKIQNNELMLQFMQMTMSSSQNADFTPFIELMDFEDKEVVLDKIRASRRTEIAQMREQMQQLLQENQAMLQQLQQYKQTMSRAQAAMTTRNQQMAEDRAASPLRIPEGLAQNAV